MEMLVGMAVFALGILLVVKGGDAFVEAAGGLARGMGLPTFLVGATVVSLATTLPELMVSVLAAAQGKVEMAVGNALGSVTANTALILASGMVMLPGVEMGKKLKIPCILLLAAIGGLYLACSGGRLSGWGSGLLIGVCMAFLLYNVLWSRKDRAQTRETVTGAWVWKFLLGAAGIVAGSQMLVSGGESIAKVLGVPERIIAVTMVAVGTSLPELVTTLAAISKGEAALSMGNIVGANIIDLTLILPFSALASGDGLPISAQNLQVDLPGCGMVLLVAAVPLLLTGKSSRILGVLLWVLYVCYLLCML